MVLLAMQRFQNRHWGLNPHVDSRFGELSEASTTIIIPDQNGGQHEIVLDCSKGISHYGLNGRATNVHSIIRHNFPSKVKLVAKLFWCEESRISEPNVLKDVEKIAQKEADVRNHIPAMVFYHVFVDSSTSIIRRSLSMHEPGSRILYFIVFEELMPITQLVGEPFLKCWWDAVRCEYPSMPRPNLR